LQADIGKTHRGHRAASSTPRLAVTGNAANRPSALSSARSLAASTFTTLAE
jgi:hypothetical protein